MRDDEQLVTVATFDSLVQAELAQGLLESEGIRSFLADGETINTNWLLSGAVGGAKLQVGQSDFLRAERLLGRQRGKSSARGLDDYGFVAPREAITADPADYDFGASSDAITTDPARVREEAPEPPGEDDGEGEIDNEAENTVRAALRAAILGLFLCPPSLHLYSLWLLGQAAQMNEPLRGRHRKNYMIAKTIDVVVLLAASFLIVFLFIGAVLRVLG